jgi:hypothetical protein
MLFFHLTGSGDALTSPDLFHPEGDRESGIVETGEIHGYRCRNPNGFIIFYSDFVYSVLGGQRERQKKDRKDQSFESEPA